MAIVFSYPPIGKNDVQPSDRLLLSQMTVDGNPTRSVTVNTLRQYLGAIIPTNIVTGVGTTNRLARWTNGPGGIIGDSGITDDGATGIKIPYAVNIENATSTANGIVFPHPAGGASGIVNMYYNGAAAGSRFVISRAATGGAEIELQSNGDVNINRLGNGNLLVGGEVTLDDYGSGAITGIPTFNLEVDANGKIIETAGGGGIGGTGTINTIPKFTAANTIGDSSITDDGANIFVTNPLRAQDYVDFQGEIRANTAIGNPGDVLTANGAGNPPFWTNMGWKSVQVFQWNNGNPTAYVNFPIGSSYLLPFNLNPQIETGNYPGSAASYAWSAATVVDPLLPTGLYTSFTLGPNGAGTWEISTAQHWFDQNQFLEVNVYLRYLGVLTAIVDQRVNDGAGNRMFYGTIIRDIAAGATVEIVIEFVNGTGANPFPSDSNNRPIEVTFTKLV